MLLVVLALGPFSVAAQAITQAQIEQFKSLPRAQQEALARQYGVDLSQVNESERTDTAQAIQPVEPEGKPQSRQDSEEAQQRKRQFEQERQQDREKNGGLEPFGYDLFADSPSTFAPVTEIPVPVDYVLGPGDVLRVQLWGKENQRFELQVSRDGTVNIPQAGPRAVAGLSFEEASRQIRKVVTEQYMGVQASVSLGALRSMRVFVLGEARTPGAYTVSSLSTISNALFVSGGIKHSGSLRKVQHKRNGQLVGEMDLYALLLAGDTSKDNRLQPGDVIFIPPVGPRAGVAGEVYRPALYELKGPTKVDDLIQMAGGLTPQAYPQNVRIERTNEQFLRILTEADLTTNEGRSKQIKPGDHAEVAAISDITGQYVEILGAVARPGRFAWVPGMRVSSLITTLESDLTAQADRQHAAIVRTHPETDQISVISLDLRQAVRNRLSEADMQLQEKDQLLVFSHVGERTDQQEQEALREEQRQEEELTKRRLEGGEAEAVELTERRQKKKEQAQQAKDASRAVLLAPVLRQMQTQASPARPQQIMSISGPVNYPGDYPIPASGSVADAIRLAGGLKDSASMLTAELARSVIDESGIAQTQILRLDLQEVLAGAGDIQLHSRDRLLIKPIPQFALNRTVVLEGEVRYAGAYTFREGETLAEVLARAGGLTANAFPRGAVFTREKLRELEARRLIEAEERLQGDLLGLTLEGRTVSQGTNKLDQLQELLEEVQNARPLGRMVINLEAVLADTDYQPIRLQDGDRLSVPQIPQAVSVFGEVQFPTSHLHTAGLTVDDYLDRSGGPTRQADEDRVYVIKADGSVVLPEKSRWFGGRNQQLAVGDTIIVPINVDRLNQLELWTNVSQIVYQMALGAAAVGNL
ncbi:SLBB domain-containing protein [Marinobacter salicampi]|uniref:SLBB domain-containing protein n=1 Tax=Marinobacter salicampi TaxID=435907 RepID=UPI003BF7FD97